MSLHLPTINEALQAFCQSPSLSWHANLQVYKGVLDGYQEVAIKFVPPGAMQNASADMGSFHQEINIMRACRSEFVVSFVGALSQARHRCIKYKLV